MALVHTTAPVLRSLIGHFKTSNARMAPSAFRMRIDEYLENRIQPPVGPAAMANQRPQSTTFAWGHDHDFGDFFLSGQMGCRHIRLLSRFFDHFGIRTDELKGRQVLDVGCWTGGVSLILERLGASVTAIDEVWMYPHALSFLAAAFGLTSLEALHKSLYELGNPSFLERYDFAFCLGVVYHLTDPIVGLRRLFHALRPDGILYLETMAVEPGPSGTSICEYEGPSKLRGKFGWNWFVPSPQALARWLEDTGFEVLRIGDGDREWAVTAAKDPLGPGRCMATARKRPGHTMSHSGLSTPVL